MFVAGPPSATGTPRGAHLVRLCRRRLASTSALAHDPLLRVFLTDLVRPYGLPLREDLLTEGAGQSFGDLAQPLLAEAVGPDEPVDLLVLAFAMHDIRLGRATATYLSHCCPGNPMAFAVCEQGAAAAFTGIRLIQEYLGAGLARRALLMVVEQSALHYEPAGPAPIPDRHAAVCLRFDSAEEGAADKTTLGPVTVRPAVAPDQLAGLLPAGPVIIGAGLAARLPELPADAVVAEAGAPFTGVWWALADHPAGPVLVADYAAELGYLCTFSLALDGVALRPDAETMVVLP